MSRRTYLVQAATLVAAAVVLALVSNAFASRQRQMKLVGFYPNAQKVPPREEPVVPTATVAPSAPELPAVTGTQLPVASSQPVTSSQLPVATTTTQAPVAPVVPTATQATGNRQPVTPTAQPAPTPQKDALAKFKPHEKEPYIEIPYADVRLLHDHGALFLDARRTSVYEQGHIAGSRPVSVWESDVDDKVAKIFNERSDPAQQALPIVVYCSGGDCEDSHMLAQKLYGALFNNVYVYKDGFPDWQKHGGAVHTGGEP